MFYFGSGIVRARAQQLYPFLLPLVAARVLALSTVRLPTVVATAKFEGRTHANGLGMAKRNRVECSANNPVGAAGRASRMVVARPESVANLVDDAFCVLLCQASAICRPPSARSTCAVKKLQMKRRVIVQPHLCGKFDMATPIDPAGANGGSTADSSQRPDVEKANGAFLEEFILAALNLLVWREGEQARLIGWRRCRGRGRRRIR